MADGQGPWRRPYGGSHPIVASGHGPGADRGLMGVRGKGGTRQARHTAADSVPDPLRAARDESEGYLDQRAAPCIQSDSTRAVPMLPLRDCSTEFVGRASFDATCLSQLG